MINFDEATHTYTDENGKKLISVTQLMKKHGLAPSYDGVDPSVLNAKAERGSLIHKEIEDYNKHNEIGFTIEQANYINYIKRNKIKVLESELMLYNNTIAGTCDLILEKGQDGKYIIADIKTTYQLHKEAVSWQLSIYLYIYLFVDIDFMPLNNKFNEWNEWKGQAFHFDKDGNLNVVDIPLKPYEEIEKLIEAERLGEIYKPNQDLLNVTFDLVELEKVEALIADLEKQKKAAEATAQEMRQALLQAMEKYGIKNYETEKIKVTYVAPYQRSGFDKAKLEKDLPEIAAKYAKKTDVQASLKITLKEAKNG